MYKLSPSSLGLMKEFYIEFIEWVNNRNAFIGENLTCNIQVPGVTLLGGYARIHNFCLILSGDVHG